MATPTWPGKWKDGETPITAAELNKRDAEIQAKAKKGDPGSDGFPTEEQWNALVDRIDALEAPAD